MQNRDGITALFPTASRIFLSFKLPCRGLVLAGVMALGASGAAAQTSDPDPDVLVPETVEATSVPQAPASSPPSWAAGQGQAPALTRADLEDWLDGYMPYALEQGDIAGAVVTVVKDGEILLSKGYGYSNLETRAPVAPDETLFRPGSISKLFTWTAVMQLVEQGVLDLGRDINAYLDFEIPKAYGEPITLRHLMTHTPGFEETAKWLILSDPEVEMPLGEYLKRGLPPRIFPPGEIPAYSNYGTALAGHIVARVSGQPFAAYIEEHIFAPLGMKHSTFRQPLPERLADDMSKGYVRASEGEAKPFEMVVAAPAGALSSTGVDMGKFMIAHLQGGGPLLEPETARRMHSEEHPNIPPLNAMLLGFYEQNRNGLRIIGHGGDTQYFHSNLHLYLDKGVGLFVSMNSAGKNGASGRVRSALFAGFTDRYFPQPIPEIEPLETAQEHAAVVSGVYDNSRGTYTNFLAALTLVGQLEIKAKDNGDLVTSFLKDVSGAPKRWREIEPFVWQEIGGRAMLAAQVEGGDVTELSMEPISPFMTFLPAPWWRSSALLLPLLYAAVAALLLTVILWPVRAVVRWRFGKPPALTGSPAYAYHLVRVGALLVLCYLAAWGGTIMWLLADLDHLDGSADGLLRLLQVAMIIPLLALALALWNAWLVWTRGRGWFGKFWSLILLLAAIIVIWFAFVGGWFSFDLSY